jgi:hypothetical protein
MNFHPMNFQGKKLANRNLGIVYQIRDDQIRNERSVLTHTTPQILPNISGGMTLDFQVARMYTGSQEY